MWGTPTYRSWSGMMQRVLNPKRHNYPQYGGRGIFICERWMIFEHFLADMGPRPVGTTLDRIDPDGPYCLGNCRWADKKQQANNTSRNVRLAYGGVTHTVTEWAKLLDLPESTLRNRLFRLGWTMERVIADVKAKRDAARKMLPFPCPQPPCTEPMAA
jgi:hypothetical protein